MLHLNRLQAVKFSILSHNQAEPPAKRPALEEVSGSLTAGDSSPPVPSLPSHAPEKPFGELH